MATASEHLAVFVGWSQYTDGRSTNLSWVSRQWSGYVDASNFYQHRQHASAPNGGGDTYLTFNNQTPQPATRYDVYVFEMDLHSRSVVSYYGQYGTTWPAFSDLKFCGIAVSATGTTINDNQGVPYVSARYPWLGVTAASAGSTQAKANVLLKKILVQTQ
jgi:hypothetical protein